MARTRPRARPKAERATAQLDKPLTYDARRAPDHGHWLERSEQERLDAVRRFHVTPPLPHQLPASLEAHSAIHAVIETQLASGDPPEAKRALGRLLSEGLTRHDAIHALGSTFASGVWEVAEGDPKAFDVDAYKRALRSLDYAHWRELVDGSAPPPQKRKARKSKKRG
jgi:hypothetical protein